MDEKYIYENDDNLNEKINKFIIDKNFNKLKRKILCM
jgi:hypothetical protein